MGAPSRLLHPPTAVLHYGSPDVASPELKQQTSKHTQKRGGFKWHFSFTGKWNTVMEPLWLWCGLCNTVRYQGSCRNYLLVCLTNIKIKWHIFYVWSNVSASVTFWINCFQSPTQDIPILQERRSVLLCCLSVVLFWPSCSFDMLLYGMCHSPMQGWVSITSE